MCKGEKKPSDFFKLFLFIKGQFFWEGHKNVRNRPYDVEIYLVNIKTIRTIAQIFVAFSENLIIIKKHSKNVKNI